MSELPTNTVSLEEYRRHIQRTKDQGNYFLLFRPYALTFGRDVAMMLCDVLNFAGMRSNPSGWFHVSLKDLHESLDWDNHAQSRIIGKLVKFGILTVQYKGVPPRRLMSVDLLRIERLVDDKLKHARKRTLEHEGSRKHIVNASYEAKKDKENPPLIKAGSLQGTNMGFKEELGIEEPNHRKGFNLIWAHQLRDAIRRVRPIKLRNWSPSKWAQFFRLLRKEHSVQTIDGVLTWYCSELDEDTNPFVQNAEHFRNAFKWIKDKYDKAMKRNVVVSDDARFIGTQLRMKIWPKDTERQIDPAVQLTIDGINRFKRKLWQFAEANPEWIKTKSKGKTYSTSGGVVAQFAHHLSNVLPPSSHFAQLWLTDVYHRFANNDRWGGDLIAKAFTGDVNDPEFDKYVAGLCSQFSGNRHAWDKLKEELAK